MIALYYVYKNIIAAEYFSIFRHRGRMIWLTTHTFTGCNVLVNTGHLTGNLYSGWRTTSNVTSFEVDTNHLTWAPFLPINSMSMLLANYLEPGYHNLLVLPFRLWVLLAHYQFPSSTFIVQYCAPNVSIFLEN